MERISRMYLELERETMRKHDDVNDLISFESSMVEKRSKIGLVFT